MAGLTTGVRTFFLLVSLVMVCYGVDLRSLLVCPDDVVKPFEYMDQDGNLFANVSWTEPEINGTAIGTDTWSLIGDHPEEKFSFGDTIIEYTLSTGSDSTTCNFTVSVVDDEDPIISGCPANQNIHIQGSETASIVTWTDPTVMDNSGHVTLTSTHQSGESLQSGTTNVIYTAVDIGGNSVQCSFEVTVLGYPQNLFAKTNGVYLVGEDDKIITVNEVDCLIACIEETDFVCHSVDFKEADQRCVLSRKDISMDGVSVQTDTSYVHWKRLIDSTSPSIEGCPYDLTRSTITGTNYTTVQWEPPVFRDSSDITSIIQSHSPGDRFYIGSTIVTYTATDAFDNSATCTFTVITQDTEKPVLSSCPESINYVIPDYYTSDQTEVISWEPPSCTDNSYRYSLTASQEPGSIFYKGVTDVSYTCSDASSNVNRCMFTVNVKTTDELSKIDMSIELLNVAYSDALANQDSEQFHALESDIVSVIDDLYENEENFVGSVVNMFSSGSVLANLRLTFFDEVDDETERYYLDILLQQTVTGELGDFIVGDVLVLGGNGEYVTLDACYTLPCPDEMVCQASGLKCNALCEDNADYCLNDARCVAEDNLIGCTCSSSDYYGARCQIVDKWSQAEIAAVVFGGFWGVMMVVLLILFVTCKCIERIQQPKTHNSAESVLVEKTNYAIENKAFIVDPSADLPEVIDGVHEDTVSEVDGYAIDSNNEEDLDERKDTYHYTGSIEDYKMDSISGSGNRTPSISDSANNKAPSITASVDRTPSASRSGSREPSTSDFASRPQSIPGSVNRTPSGSGSASQASSTLSGSTSRVQLISS